MNQAILTRRQLIALAAAVIIVIAMLLLLPNQSFLWAAYILMVLYLPAYFYPAKYKGGIILRAVAVAMFFLVPGIWVSSLVLKALVGPSDLIAMLSISAFFITLLISLLIGFLFGIFHHYYIEKPLRHYTKKVLLWLAEKKEARQ